MNVAIVIFVLLLSFAMMIGLFIGALQLVRRGEHFEPNALEEQGQRTLQLDGYTLERTLLRRQMGTGKKSNFVYYSDIEMALPSSFRGLEMSDAAAREIRRSATPITPEGLGQLPEIITIGAPDTGDPVFDGAFDLGSPLTPELRELLADRRVRMLLLEVQETFAGTWVRDGRLRVLERDSIDGAGVEASVEYLVGVALRLDQVVR